MKNLFIPLALALLASLFSSGCAVLSQPRTEPVFIDSTPSGATVYQNGEEMGTTPITLTYDRQDAPLVVLEKEGFVPVQIKIRRGLNGVGKLDAVFCWTFFPLFDFCSYGRALEYKETHVVVPMQTEDALRDSLLTRTNARKKHSRADAGTWISPYVLVRPYNTKKLRNGDAE